METLSLSCLAIAFHERTLPKTQWTHHAHLKVGLWTLLRFPPDEALNRLRVAIRTYNESVGGINSDSAGYHETITAFYVRVIDRFLSNVGRTRPADELAEELIRLHGDKELPLRYWSKQRPMSSEARLSWVEPDLCPLQ
jgi:hypothetical protein